MTEPPLLHDSTLILLPEWNQEYAIKRAKEQYAQGILSLANFEHHVRVILERRL